jgi:hypothetical protein
VKCPVEFTGDLSAQMKAARMLEIDNSRIDQRRGNGADDEIARRNSEGDGKEDQLDGGS